MGVAANDEEMIVMKDDVQFIEASHRFEWLDGSITLTPGAGRHTWQNLNTTDAGELYADLLSLFTEDSGFGQRVVVQYQAGISGREAGSMWFDLGDAEGGADTVLGWLWHLDAQFSRGIRFTP